MGAQKHPAERLNRVANQICSPRSRARSGRFGGLNSAPPRPIWQPLMVLALLIVFLLCSGPASASVTASISGTVKDQTGSAIVGATVTATNTDTNIAETQPTNSQGFYSFQALLLGPYRIDIQQTGFKAFRQTDLVLDVNAALVVDATLQVGQVTETVTVASTALHVETASTQMGEVIGGHEMTTVPLVTRGYTDLLALQPGVVPQSSGIGGQAPGAFNSAGFAVPLVSGDLNAGNLSVNGMRESANGFLLNGATVQEGAFGGTAIVPNLDSIAEFRILTNNFDAEYGNFSGGQINVITKSGTNQYHGNAFEFVRNTVFDARSFFDPQRGAYHQNQFGGTIGGPILHDKVFFFADYQGNRKVRGVSSGLIFVPSDLEKMGNFSALGLPPTRAAAKTVTPGFDQVLTTQLMYPVQAAEPYFYVGCNNNNPASPTGCVFPNGQVPVTGFSPPVPNLLPFIHSPK